MLGTEPDLVTSVALSSREVWVTEHALQTWLKRVDYHPSAREYGVRELEKMLRGCAWDSAEPAWIRPSLWHRARAEGYLVVEGGCLPVVRNPDGRLVATTYLRQEGRPR